MELLEMLEEMLWELQEMLDNMESFEEVNDV